jgi:hypothetical protein
MPHLRTFLLFLLVIGSGALVQAAMVEVPLKATTTQATEIVQGEVISQSSDWNPGYQTILTDVVVRVDESIKGSLSVGQTITIRIEGGEVGETGIWVEHQPRFRDAEEVLLFLRYDEEGHHAVQSLEQGMFTVFEEAAYDYQGRRNSLPELKSTIRFMAEQAPEQDER